MDDNGRSDEATDVLASIRRLVADEAEKALAPARKASGEAEPSPVDAPEEQSELPRTDPNRDWLIGAVNHGRRAGTGDAPARADAPAAKEVAQFLRERDAKSGPRFALLQTTSDEGPETPNDDAPEDATGDAAAERAPALSGEQALAEGAAPEEQAAADEITGDEPAVTFTHRAREGEVWDTPEKVASPGEPEVPPSGPEQVTEAEPAEDIPALPEEAPAPDAEQDIGEHRDAAPAHADGTEDQPHAAQDAPAPELAEPEPIEELHAAPVEASAPPAAPLPDAEAESDGAHGFTPWDRASLAEGLRQLDQRAPPGAPVRLLLTDEFRIEGGGDLRPMFARSPARRYTEDSDVTDPVPSSPMPGQPLELGTAPEDAAASDDAAPDELVEEAAPAADEDEFIDEDTLRALVADIVRQELQGALGERITRNVRKLVRAEIAKALETYSLTLEVPGPDSSEPDSPEPGSSDPHSG